MSYILDALQKSSAASTTDTLEAQPRTETVGLSLPWKLAIGAVLATNLVFLYLWQSDREDTELGNAELSNQQDRKSRVSGTPQTQRPSAPYTQSNNPTAANSSRAKKTLPGIASPRDWPPPAPAASAKIGNSTSTGAARTFKPTGAPITIADAPVQSEQFSPPAASERAQQAKPPVAERSTQREQTEQTEQTESRPKDLAEERVLNRQVSTLSQLSESARQSLYVLTFSFHIYAEDADLRAVVVNGRRLTEGSTIESDGNQNFELVEILENGVVVKFDHEGKTNSVQIPVMEDWKDA